MKRVILADRVFLPKKIQVEVDRHNVTPREFFYECKQAAKRKGTDLEAYVEYNEWIHPTVEMNSRSAATDDIQQISQINPLDYHLYVENTYNFMMEFEFDDDKRGHGYMYLAEW